MAPRYIPQWVPHLFEFRGIERRPGNFPVKLRNVKEAITYN